MLPPPAAYCAVAGLVKATRPAIAPPASALDASSCAGMDGDRVTATLRRGRCAPEAAREGAADARLSLAILVADMAAISGTVYN
jgi:hypothetical protein